MRHDWGRLAGLAMARLGWTPETFWGATPLDLLQALKGQEPQGALEPMSRAELMALGSRFPDGEIDGRRLPSS